jgi:heme exporter protein A
MIAGRNGSGKSTLLRVLSTAIRADRGSARLLDLDLVGDREALRRRLAFLSHDSHHYEALTALENLRIAARFLGRDDSRTALVTALAEVDLGERADDPVATFSSGMRKRLSLARVLLKNAEVVLLDEPYAALDPQGFRLVDRLLARLRSEGRTVLMATHLLERGSALCDEGLLLDSGRLVWSGSARALPVEGALATDARMGAER